MRKIYIHTDFPALHAHSLMLFWWTCYTLVPYAQLPRFLFPGLSITETGAVCESLRQLPILKLHHDISETRVCFFFFYISRFVYQCMHGSNRMALKFEVNCFLLDVYDNKYNEICLCRM